MVRQEIRWAVKSRISASIALCALELVYIVAIVWVLNVNAGDCEYPLRLWLKILLGVFTMNFCMLVLSECFTPFCSYRVQTLCSIAAGVCNSVFTLFAIAWFIVGNFWFYHVGELCYEEFYEGYTLVFIILIVYYCFIGSICCFGCILVYQIAIGVGVHNQRVEY